MSKIYISEKSWYIYYKLPSELQLNFDEFEEFYNTKPNKKHEIFIFGKYVEQPRYTQTYGKDYIYSNTISKSIPFTKLLSKYLIFVNKLDNNSNMALVNWYNNGKEYIGWHSDDEKQIKKCTPIISITFGAERDFQIREKKNKKNKISIKLQNNSYLIMGGDFQDEFQHQLPRRLKCKEKRINITFREII